MANSGVDRASRDVVLSAGAVDSPKLLMLSGVGDKDELAQFGIESTRHLPAIGKGFEDHFFTTALWRETDNLKGWSAVYSDPEATKKAYDDFAKDGSGPLSVFYQGMTSPNATQH